MVGTALCRPDGSTAAPANLETFSACLLLDAPMLEWLVVPWHTRILVGPVGFHASRRKDALIAAWSRVVFEVA